MALHNEIGAGRYNRLLQKLFNMKGGPPARQLGTDIIATIPFFSGAEHRYLESWDRFGTFVVFGPVAAVVNILQLNNPPTSNVVIVFEKINLGNTAGADAYVITSAGNNPAALTTPISFATTRWDPRGKPNPVLSGSQQQTALVDLGIPRYEGFAPVNQMLEVITTDIQEFPLLPGDAIRIRNNVVNQNSTFNFWWRERALEDSEFK